jgi:heterodisulfide reductase subunit C2
MGETSAASVDVGQDGSLADRLRAASGIDVDRCYECGKCSGGCSALTMFDYSPRQIVQLVRLGREDTLLHMAALSSCVGCGLCTARCPAEIDVAAILEHFRHEAHAREVPLARERVELLDQLFLEQVMKRGRTSELHLMAKFNMKSRQYFKDVDTGLKLLWMRRLRLRAPEVADKQGVREIVARSRLRRRA